MTGHSKSLSAPKKGPPVDPKLVHHYVRPPGTWPSSDPPCVSCERPEASRYHDVPPTPKAAKEIDARVLGEDPDQS